jgi:hypothetical protein
MKNVKDMTLKTLLVIALLATPTFADGDMGGGGLAGYETEGKSGTMAEGDMGGGGFRSTDEEVTFMDSLIAFFDLIG